MRLFRFLLFPFSIIFLLITQLRNHLFDIGYTKSLEFEVKTIGVGNLSVGGTGKSPMIEYLILLLKKKCTIATLSRGYGRRSSGFIIANEACESKDIGDEPRQFYLKFKEDVCVCVGEDRVLAIPEIMYHRPDTEVVLLDDAFQHRYIVPGINIMLSDYKNIFYKDFILPVGNLREARSGAKRADVIVISKCPEDISAERMEDIKNKCHNYVSKKTPVFFSSISYLPPVKVFDSNKRSFSSNLLLFSGIGKSSYFEQSVSEKYNVLHVEKFPDHHKYTLDDLLKLKKRYDMLPGDDKCLLTTEKDMVKIKELKAGNDILDLPLFYLPIEMKFIDQQQKFDALIWDYISSKKF